MGYRRKSRALSPQGSGVNARMVEAVSSKLPSMIIEHGYAFFLLTHLYFISGHYVWIGVGKARQLLEWGGVVGRL